MSKLKCPFCNGELYGCIGHPYCRNEKCEMCDEMMPQELLDLLYRTQKELGIAKSKLNGIHRLYSKAFYTRDDWLQVCMEMVDKANTALDKIKVLEQKDK